jgi:hypothetical protein
LPEDALDTIDDCGEHDTPAVGRPRHAAVLERIERQALECPSSEVPQPDVTFLIANVERHAASVRRDSRICVASLLRGNRLFPALPIDPDERAFRAEEGVA